MDDTIYKIAIAGFFHDIGKFAERAGMLFENGYIEKNADLYQPAIKGRYTHRHALYTAAFIERYENVLPAQFNQNQWGLGDSFINLAAMHHKPETNLQWIIAIANRVSSGFDRRKFDTYNEAIDVKDYTKTRLISIFCLFLSIWPVNIIYQGQLFLFIKASDSYFIKATSFSYFTISGIFICCFFLMLSPFSSIL